MQILEDISNKYKKVLGNNLIGIYVHGSIAFGCFNWDKSDIDFLVVLKESPTQNEKEEMIQTLLDLSNIAPQKGLEMSVVLESYCKQFIYPTPFELHFSNMHIQKYNDNLSKYCRTMHGTDKDLAAHLTVINNVGISLYGKAIKDVFGDIPKEYYIDSIKYDIENAKNEIMENPVYIVLNLCRVLAYIQSGEVLSKAQGGLWGIKHLSPKFGVLIKNAVESYSSDNIMSIDKNIAYQFCDYMNKKIYAKEKGW